MVLKYIRDSSELELYGQSLKNLYPVCVKLIGDERFYELILEYLKNYSIRCSEPKCSGKGFPSYLSRKIYTENNPSLPCYIPDIARLEWAIYRSSRIFYSSPSAEQVFAEISRQKRLIPGSDFGLKVNPSISLVYSCFPIRAIWEANQGELMQSINTDGTKCFLVIWSEDSCIKYRSLKEKRFDLLRRLGSGITLKEVAGNVCDPDVLFECFIKEMIEYRWIVGVL